jgi:hypothetical protein
MDVYARRRKPGHDVLIVYDTVHFHVEMFPEHLVPDSGRTECIDALDVAVPAGKKRRQGASQAVPGDPYLATFLLDLPDMVQKVGPDFIQRFLEPPVHFPALFPIGQPEIHIRFQIGNHHVQVSFFPFSRDFASPENNNRESIIIGHIALRAFLFEKCHFRQAGLAEPGPDEILIRIRQGGSFRKPPGIDSVKGGCIEPERIFFAALEIVVVLERRREVLEGNLGDFLFPGQGCLP